MENFQEDLTLKERFILMEEQKRAEKKMVVAYLLWFFFGMFGVHRFYAGKTKTGIMMLAIPIISIALFIIHVIALYLKLPEGIHRDFVSFFLLCVIEYTLIISMIFGGKLYIYNDISYFIVIISIILYFSFLLIYTIDVFLINRIVREYNRKLKHSIIQEIKENRKKMNDHETFSEV